MLRKCRCRCTQPRRRLSPQTLVVGPVDAQEYLARIGIPVTAVDSAIRRGEARAMENSGPEYPKTGAGLSRWIETVGSLRRTLMRTEWQPEDPQNRPICVDPNRNVFLGVVGGTEDTGVESSEAGPKAQRRKGSATEEAPIGQTVLYTRAELVSGPTGLNFDDAPPVGNWFVLYHRGKDHGQIEVSYPRGLKDGQFTGWVVRVIIPPFSPETADVSPQYVGGGDVGFDVTQAS